MSRINTIRTQRARALAGAIALGAMGMFAAVPAHAHFILDAPTNWMSQVPGDGSPQKLGPCGDEGGGTPTGMVTNLTPQADGTYRVNIMWHDTVPHPGHYRVALAINSRDELPPEPIVTPTAADACASAAIVNPPYTLPMLADNVNPHTSTLAQGAQMLTVTIPASVSCTHCTLQVLEFMSLHGAPCFYHHCADLSMGNVAPGTGGRGAGGAAGRGGGTGGTAGGRGGSTGAGGTTTGTGGATTGSGGLNGSGGAKTGSGGANGSGGSAVGSGGAMAGGLDGGTDAVSTGSPTSSGGCTVALSRKPVRGTALALFLGLAVAALARRRRP